MKDVQTLPGADIDCDHNLLFAKMCTRLKKGQNGVWRNYMLNDKECRIHKKRNWVQLNVKVGMSKCSGEI